MENNKSYSVVIPVYNSESTLDELISQLAEILPILSNSYEVVLVNDGSYDLSWDVICKLTELYPWIFGINLMRNYGQHNALLCGIRTSKNDIIITMDDDLQHPPLEIVKLIEKLDEGYDVVYGIPHKLPHSLWRNILSRVTKQSIARVMGIPYIRDISAFRVFKAKLRAAFVGYHSPNLLLDVLLSWGTSSFGTVEVHLMPRKNGKSNYNFLKLFNQAMLVLTGFSTGPLRLASVIGFTFTIFGVLILVYVIGRYLLQGDSVPGFPFLASIIAIFSGAQLFALGIIGEYLARIFNRSVERPTYIVKETTTSSLITKGELTEELNCVADTK